MSLETYLFLNIFLPLGPFLDPVYLIGINFVGRSARHLAKNSPLLPKNIVMLVVGRATISLNEISKVLLPLQKCVTFTRQSIA